MRFEQKDRDASPLWEWSSRQCRSPRADVQFDPLQLELPLGVEALSETPTGRRRSTDWQLPSFLALIGVGDPAVVARVLTTEFRSLPGLLSASTARIAALVGSRIAEAIDTTRELMRATLIERVAAAPLVSRSVDLIEFLTAEIGFLDQERLLSIYVNSELRLMRIETIADGHPGEVLLYARKIISSGLAIGASGYVLVHNHPSGIPSPSDADLIATSRIRRLSAELGLQLVDHLIVARGRFGSIDDHWRESRWKSAALPESD